MTLWAAGHWSFPWCHQAHRAFYEFAKLNHLSFKLANFLLHFSLIFLYLAFFLLFLRFPLLNLGFLLFYLGNSLLNLNK